MLGSQRTQRLAGRTPTDGLLHLVVDDEELEDPDAAPEARTTTASTADPSREDRASDGAAAHECDLVGRWLVVGSARRADAPNEALCENALDRRCDQVVGHAEIDEAWNRSDRVIRVQRREDHVARHRRLHRYVGRLGIA